MGSGNRRVQLSPNTRVTVYFSKSTLRSVCKRGDADPFFFRPNTYMFPLLRRKLSNLVRSNHKKSCNCVRKCCLKSKPIGFLSITNSQCRSQRLNGAIQTTCPVSPGQAQQSEADPILAFRLCRNDATSIAHMPLRSVAPKAPP